MPPSRPFRFATSMPPLADLSGWRSRLRRIEDLGFDTVAVSDHYSGGWAMDPVVAMAVALEATTRLRVAATVFSNELRHPAVLHKSMANLDVYSGGRLEIGLGAGWKQADHVALGIPFEAAQVRVDRLAEALDIVRGLFGPAPLTYVGRYYRIQGLDGLPKPLQRPHPPLLVGGGSRRVLQLAGRVANIVGLNPRLSGVDPAAAVIDQTPERVAQKIAWARSAAVEAGREPSALEFQLPMLDVRVTVAGVQKRYTSSLAANASPQALTASLSVLHGDVDACVDMLVAIRERLGISYFHLGSNVDAAAPVVARLSSQ